MINVDVYNLTYNFSLSCYTYIIYCKLFLCEIKKLLTEIDWIDLMFFVDP